jgi:hypothetical protein
MVSEQGLANLDLERQTFDIWRQDEQGSLR